MDNGNIEDVTLETIEILENAIVIYMDGSRKLFDAIHITNRGVIIGYILRLDNIEKCMGSTCCEVFVESGGIPKNNVKYIEGGVRKVVYTKKL